MQFGINFLTQQLYRIERADLLHSVIQVKQLYSSFTVFQVCFNVCCFTDPCAQWSELLGWGEWGLQSGAQQVWAG